MTYSPDQYMVDPRNPSNWDDERPEPNRFHIDPNQFSDEDYEDIRNILMETYTNEADAQMDAFAIARVLGKPVTIDVWFEDASVEWSDIIIVKPNVRVA